MDLDTRGVVLSRTTMDVAERLAAMADRRPLLTSTSDGNVGGLQGHEVLAENWFNQ